MIRIRRKTGDRGPGIGRYLMLGAFCLSLFSCASGDIFPDIGDNLSSPLDLNVDSAAARLYVSNSNNKVLYKNASFQVYDITKPASPVLIDTVIVPQFSGDSYLDIPAKRIYFTNRYSENNQVNVDHILRINVDEGSADFLKLEQFADGFNPFGLTYSATNSNLYTGTSDSNIDYFNIATPEKIKAVSIADLDLSDGSTLEATQVRELVAIGSQLYISRAQGGILVYDMNEDNVDYFVYDFNAPSGISTDGTYAYLADVEVPEGKTTPVLYEIDPSAFPPLTGNNTTVKIKSKSDPGVVRNFAVVGTDSNAQPQEVAISSDYLFVSNMGNDTVTVVNRSDFSRKAEIEVGDEPFGLIVYSPGGVETHLYVSNINSNDISIIDLASMTVVGTYPK